jgi:hypothetical protein
MSGTPRTLVLPDNVETDGTLSLLMTPFSTLTSWPPPLSDLTKETTQDITYDLTTDGWSHGKSQEDTSDERLTLREILGGFGKTTHDISLTYFYGTESSIVDPMVNEGDIMAVFARFAVPWEQDFRATDKWDLFKLIAGTKTRNAPAANGKWTKTQKFKPRSGVLEDVTLA